MRAFRFRYSLGGLLLLMAAIGGWCAFHSSRARLEQRVERAVLTQGGVILYGRANIEEPRKPKPLNWYGNLVRSIFGERHISVIDLRHKPISDDLLESIAELPHLESLILIEAQIDDAKLALLLRNQRLQRLLLSHNPAITDSGCASLARLTQLRDLSLDNAQVTDATLDVILRLDKLERIGLSRTNVTGKGLDKREGLGNLKEFCAEKCKLSDDLLNWLSKCSRLELAYLDNTGITDVGIQHFAGHPSLTRIVLSNNRLVTDRSFEVLAGCPKLKNLSMGDGVTRAGIEEFRRRRPDVELR